MQKIFSFGASDILTGITPYQKSGNFGLFATASQVNPFLNGNSTGILKTSADPTSLSNIVDTPMAFAVDYGSTNYGYFLGSSGHFYKVQLPTGTPSDLRSSTITSPANGVAIFQPNGGTKYLYYWQETQIGRWDLSGTYPTGWTDNNYTGLQSTAYHPVHRFFDVIFYGNKDRIGQLKDDGAAGVTHSTNVLDFPSTSTVLGLCDDGQYLVSSVTQNVGVVGAGSSKFIFWDTNSSYWQKEWTVQDPAVSSLKNIDGVIYGLGTNGLWAFTYNEAPRLVRNDVTIGYGVANAMSRIGNAVMYGGQPVNSQVSAGAIWTYGKYVPSVPTATFTPFSTLESASTQLVSAEIADGYVFAGANSKLLRFAQSGAKTHTGGGANYTISTAYFDLERQYSIGRIDVVMDSTLGSGDVIGFTVQTNVTNQAFMDMSYANFGGVDRAQLFPASGGAGLITDTLQLQIMPNTGTVDIRRIDIWGEPVTQ